MRTLTISGKTGTSTIIPGESLRNLSTYVPAGNLVVITDENVMKYYGSLFPDVDIIEIGQGEGSKTLATVETIYDRFLQANVDRSSFVVGIGGGIVCDVAGFAASTFMRGVPFGFVATTLLAQVDASIGGKNGINFRGYKNLIGTFNQPCFVICDVETLATLPSRELACGFAEIVKHAVIADMDYFEFLEQHTEELKKLDPGVTEKMIYDSLVIKAGIVSKDETEKDERRKLNFGHTFGHAVEKTVGLPHGEAISIGMAAAANLSVSQGFLQESDALRIEHLLRNLGLPVRITGDTEALIDAFRKDKKREGNDINFVLLKNLGNSFVTKISIEELEAVVKLMRNQEDW